jgi:NADH:ubiquinone oxidoreductase subunit
MDLISKIAIRISCIKVGSDEFGNQYFEAKKTQEKTKNPKKRRYVIYNGISEPSKVPANWHGWLHYTSNDLPDNTHKHSWQKIHLPNLTGTKFAYFPSGSNPENKSNISRHKVSSDYQPWQPHNN